MGGIADFLGGIGKLLGKGSTYIQSRMEKLKNEKIALEKEKQSLLSGECDEKKSARLLWINARLDTINGLLTTKAQDD
jgi:hypothetical protein